MGDRGVAITDQAFVSTKRFSLCENLKIGTGDSYILGIDSKDDLLVASLSDCSVSVVQVTASALKQIFVLNAHKERITSLKLSPDDCNSLYTSSKDGTILTWDIRSKCHKAVQIFQDRTSDTLKPINCFDIDPNGNFICCGTDQIGQDAFILFWDKRNTKLLGGYWESHTDDVTEVAYHPSQRDQLVSGSVDGLIDIFDVSQSNEDDALLNTLNTESSVGRVKWITEKSLTCITHTEELQMWDTEEIKLVTKWTRENLSENMNFQVDYLVDVLKLPRTKEVLVASGTTDGVCYVMLLDSDNVAFWTALHDGHSDVVRCITALNDTLITGSEDGLLCLWNKDLIETEKSTKKKHWNK